MFQLYDSFSQTCCQLADTYGPWVLLAVLIVTGCGIVLQLLYRFLVRGGPS
jgi:hypothetical protein